MLNVIVLSVAGRTMAHKSCSLQAGAEQAVRNGSFDVAWNMPGLPCRADEECTVTIDGEVWLTGYVRDVNWSHDQEQRDYAVSVVSRTIDATEASIDHPTGFVENCSLSDVATAFDTAGIGCEVLAKTTKKPLHQIVPGETLFQTLERAGRADGVLIRDTEKGSLKITDQPEGRHTGTISLGVNIKQASGTLSGRFNYSKVKVRGQSSVGATGAAMRPEATANGTSDRKRDIIIYHEGELTSDRAKKRAKWESKRAAGKGKAARFTLPGLRDDGGKLWEPNYLVMVVDDWGGLNQDMVIASVNFVQEGESSGTEAHLELKDPRALGGENPRGDSDEGWIAPGDEEPEYRED